MLTHKNIDKIGCVVVVFCIILSIFSMNAENLGVTQAENTHSYETQMFSEVSINTIDIIVDEDDWQNLLDNASDKEYINSNMYINGEYYTNIAIRAKGNSSLSMVQSSDSDRYSFKIEFDHYDSTKTYYGLDKLCLNNIIQDYTYMKDYLAYTLMGEFGVPSPLVNYTNVSINGEEFGLYLAVEAIEESFLQRNYGNNYGYAYKPETSSGAGGGGDMGGMQQGGMGEMPNMGAMPDVTDTAEMAEMIAQMTGLDATEIAKLIDGVTDANEIFAIISSLMGDTEMMMPGMQQGVTQDMAQGGMQQGVTQDMAQGGMQQDVTQDMAQGGMQQDVTQDMAQGGMQQTRPDMTGGMGMTGSTTTGTTSFISSSLGYSSDNVDDYAYIFDNSISNISSTDKERLISSIKQISEQENLENVLNVEEVIRYFVVHNFLLNFDSYTGSIMHNYYIYEEHGEISMLPWDYNLSFIAFQGNLSTEELVNLPIDTPVSSGTVESRAMLTWIFDNEEYTELYHELFNEFVEEMYESGYIFSLMDEVYNVIDEHVENDPSKFCTYEDFIKGVDTLKEFIALRFESIKGQLSGEIPSTAEGQTADSSTLISASHINASDAGSVQMSTGGGTDRNQGGTNNRQEQTTGNTGMTDVQGQVGANTGMTDVQGQVGANTGKTDM
ncbi:MAG: CotH kinase family protein, partial [Clostridia bacterium]